MNVVVLGAGESGLGAALLAKEKNHNVFVSEYSQIKEHYKKELLENNIHFEEGGHTFEKLNNADLVIKSPGIAEHTDIVKFIRKEKIELVSEIEFASRFCEGSIVAITGSNGKTTTTMLCHHLLEEAGLDVGLGGNIGKSFARLLLEEAKDIYVIELSSFQLDDIITFKPKVAMLLNISPDHLDRYENSIERYAKSKYRIAENQDENDVLIYNEEDSYIKNTLNLDSCKQRLVPIEISKQENTSLLTSSGINIDIKDFQLAGGHNKCNLLFAIEAAMICGATKDAIENSLGSFQNVGHRLEQVARINEVTYINDSKATNVDSVYYALDAFDGPIIWIAGGKDKGNDYNQILPVVQKKVSALICLGVDNTKLVDFFTAHLKIIEETQDISEAVDMASRYATVGSTVLLSPACASFDLFNNYENRGELFKKAVFDLLR